MASVRHGATPGSIEAILRSPAGAVTRDILRRGHRVKGAAERYVGVDHGRLRASLNVELVQHRGVTAAKIGSKLKYARHHHDGTGLYGPHRQRIYPTTKKALAFKIGGRKIVVRSVRGARGTFYLKRALRFARG